MTRQSINLPAGRRLTRSKQVILDYFSNNKEHVTADELYKQLKSTLPQIGLATIYRNLNDLAGLGILKQLSYPGMPVCYELFEDHHAHFYCQYCNKIYDIEAPGKKIETNRAWQGHYIKDVNVGLSGICRHCTKDYFG